MPEPLTAEEVNSKTDPTVAKQFDTTTPLKDQVSDFNSIVDGLKIGLLTTIRPGVGPVSRSMAVAKHTGPDFLFIANSHSNKFQDLDHDSTAQITFQDSSTQNWISITGTATTTSNSDPRIEEVWSKGTSAWFGDLGDGKHDGGPKDPRVALIEVKATYVSYWKTKVGMLGFMKEVGQASLTGQVADNGILRQFEGKQLDEVRKIS